MAKDVQIAKRAGFCFGVSRAVKLAYDGLGSGKKIVTLGPIIHNQNVTDELERRGATIINSPEDAKKGDTVIIRSHGITRAEQEKLEKNGIEIIDATCPFVKKIHNIVLNIFSSPNSLSRANITICFE